MILSSILVPIRGDGLGEGVLDHALALAKRFNSHIDVVHCRPRPEDMIPFGVFVPASFRQDITDSASGLANEEEQRLKKLFDDYCRKHSLTVVDARPWPRDQVTISWREKTGKQAAVVGVFGRLADLVAIARPDHQRNLGLNTLEAALLETGKPVLMCPPKPVGSLGAHVALAWNGSAEAARAVAMTLPILLAADQVTLLSIETDSQPTLSTEDLQYHLSDHGITANSRVLKSKASEVGQTLLGGAQSEGADLLIMGAYGQSRRRELVMGGVTQHVIDSAELPVLLTH